MITTILLVNQAAHELGDRVLAGRRCDVPLSPTGVAQSQRLAARLAARGIKLVKSSPRFRALQTGRPLARAICKPIEIAKDFDDMDFGDWAGRTFAQLDGDDHWRQWRLHRLTSRAPRGESLRDVQARVVAGVLRTATANAGQRVAIVTHAEPIRAVMLHYRGRSAAHSPEPPVDPASFTTLHVEGSRIVVVGENESAEGTIAA